MIRSQADLKRYLTADIHAHGLERWTLRHRFSALSRDRILVFQRRLRRLEYLTNVRPGPAVVLRLRLSLTWRLHVRRAERLGFTIPLNSFGPGLQIAHHGTIVVSEHSRVGAGARIHPSTSIGATNEGAARCGDRLYLGPGARLVGPICLGDDVLVGANAVVTRSFGNAVVLVGVPASELRDREPGWTH